MVFKYVIIPTGAHYNITALLLPKDSVISHLELAMRVGQLNFQETKEECLGAGFCYIETGSALSSETFVVYGRSVSIDIDSKPEDAVILNRQFGLL